MSRKGFQGVILLSIILFPVLLFAEELLVYSGQYVVEPATQLSALSEDDKDSILENRGLDIIKNVGRTSQLVRKDNAVHGLAELNSKIQAFDPEDDFCNTLISDGLAKTCSPNFVIRINATPNDTSFGSMWGLSSGSGINATSAWDVHTGSHDVVVAVIDTGVDYNHQDLKNNIWTNTLEIPNNGIDDDNNGYIDDVHGISAINGSGNPMDDNGHGTHVSGTIGAKGNNGIGVTGINWNVKIMGLKFLDANGYGGLAGAIEAIDYMTAMKQRGVNVKVSNNSWGGVGYSQGLYNAIKASTDAGIVFVAAAGNEANNNDANASYPASYEIENVVSVAAIDQNQNIANFSNYGTFSVDIAAPGVSILSTTPGNSYSTYSGTSMATPHVVGAIALLTASSPSLTPSQLVSRLYDTGDQLGTLAGLVYTSRTLNLSRLLRNQTSPVNPPSSPSAGCTYTPSEITYAPSLTADSQPVVLQADEYIFHTINLPFDFPYFNQNIRQLIVSPNGLIYTKSQPQDVDFQNLSSAPLNSIAALHTDLTSEVSPAGVRVSVSNSDVTIYWLAKQYHAQQGGYIEVRTTLSSDGNIKVFVSSDDANVITTLQSSATVGISGEQAGEKHTFAYNSPLVKNNLAVSYNASCTEETEAPVEEVVEINTIQAHTINGRGRFVKKLIPGRVLLLSFAGKGTGIIPMNISLDGKTCAKDVPVSLIYGQNSYAQTAPRYLKRYRNIDFTTNKATVKVKVRKNKRNRKKLKNKLNKAKYQKLVKRDCQRLVKKMG